MKILILLFLFLNLSCTTYKPIGESVETPVVSPEATKEVVQKKKLGRYDINLEDEFSFNSEINHITQLNNMSIDTNNKTSAAKLMDSLFVNKNRSVKDIRMSYLKVSREKKRALRKKISAKRKLFFDDQKKRRKKYSENAKIKKAKFKSQKNSTEAKKRIL